MSDSFRNLACFVLVALVASCAAPVTAEPTPQPFPAIETDQPTPLPLPAIQIARHPQPVDYSRTNIYTVPPVYDSTSTETTAKAAGAGPFPTWLGPMRSLYKSSLKLRLKNFGKQR